MNECKHGGYMNDCGFCDSEKANGVNAVLGEVAPEKVLGFYQCGRCGAELKKHNKNNFCYYCGIKLNWRNLA